MIEAARTIRQATSYSGKGARLWTRRRAANLRAEEEDRWRRRKRRSGSSRCRDGMFSICMPGARVAQYGQSRSRTRRTHRKNRAAVREVEELAGRFEQFPPSCAGRLEARARRHNQRDDDRLQRARHRRLVNKHSLPALHRFLLAEFTSAGLNVELCLPEQILTAALSTPSGRKKMRREKTMSSPLQGFR